MADQKHSEQPEQTLTINNEQIGAFNAVLRGIEIAQSRGAFNLAESGALLNAFKTIVPGYGIPPAKAEGEAENQEQGMEAG